MTARRITALMVAAIAAAGLAACTPAESKIRVCQAGAIDNATGASSDRRCEK